jgi:hypothetical protein
MLSAAQAAWTQNTSARIGGVSIWGQAVQVASLTLQLRNLILLQQATRASGQAQVMTYNPAMAVLVGGAKMVADNSVAAPVQLPTYSAIVSALSVAQNAAAIASAPSGPLWPGLASSQQNSAAATGAPTSAQ